MYKQWDEYLSMYIIEDYDKNEMYEEIEEYEKFLLNKNVEIQMFYNLGAIHLVGFPYGLSLSMFELVEEVK